MTDAVVTYPPINDVTRWAVACREVTAMTQEQWAVHTGISCSTVSRIERGLVLPHKKTLWRMWHAVRKAGAEPPVVAGSAATPEPETVGTLP